jgi:hypothetical protein
MAGEIFARDPEKPPLVIENIMRINILIRFWPAGRQRNFRRKNGVGSGMAGEFGGGSGSWFIRM